MPNSLLFQLGDSGGIENTAYDSSGNVFDAAGGGGKHKWILCATMGDAAAPTPCKLFHLVWKSPSTNTWTLAFHATKITSYVGIRAVEQNPLMAALTTVRMTVTGVNTFDGGKVNVRYYP